MPERATQSAENAAPHAGELTVSVEAMPVELHLNPVSLQQAIDDLGSALEATERGQLRDARLYAERARSNLLFAQRSVQSTMSRWQDYNARLDRLREYLREHEAQGADHAD